jgi:hypothetical protein
MTKTKKQNKVKTKKVVTEETLHFSLAIENQKKLRKLCGKVEVDDLAFE